VPIDQSFEKRTFRLVVIDDPRFADAGFLRYSIDGKPRRAVAHDNALGGVENIVGADLAGSSHETSFVEI